MVTAFVLLQAVGAVVFVGVILYAKWGYEINKD